MGHRYLAGALGLLILLVAVLAWMTPPQSPGSPARILLLVAFQATLGMWTVTMLLKPAIVTAHLLGGMAILSLLLWLSARSFSARAAPGPRALRVPAAAALVPLARRSPSAAG